MQPPFPFYNLITVFIAAAIIVELIALFIGLTRLIAVAVLIVAVSVLDVVLVLIVVIRHCGIPPFYMVIFPQYRRYYSERMKTAKRNKKVFLVFKLILILPYYIGYGQ